MLKFLLPLCLLGLSIRDCSSYSSYSYQDIIPELQQLYRLQLEDELAGDPGYYGETLDSRSVDDWPGMSYRDAKDLQDYSEAALRDQEYMKQTPVIGYQSISGGQANKQKTEESKSDRVLPAYCTPPNPCPYGYEGTDNCVKNFENTPENNLKLLQQQDCPCDAEHMRFCSAGKKTIDPKSGFTLGGDDMEDDLDLEGNAFLSSSIKRHHLVAKKAPLFREKRGNEAPYQKLYENPYLVGLKMNRAAKKSGKSYQFPQPMF